MKTTYFDENADLISYIIRRERSLRGLRLEDLADKTVSVSTISNIENQTTPVKETKIMHIMEKLGITKEALPNRIKYVQEELKEIQKSLQLIEALLNGNILKKAKGKMDSFSLDEFHPLYPLVIFFKGQYYYNNREWNKAEELLHHAINNCKQYHLNPKPNFLSFCYDLLSSCSYYQNDLTKALSYVNEGLLILDETKDEKVKYSLLGNKIIYLEKSGDNTQALELVRKVWSSIQNIGSLHVKLNLYKSRANLLFKSKQLEDALYYAEEGFYIAQSSPRNRFTFDLLMILGSIYLMKKDFKTASECFQIVIDLDPSMEFPRRHVDAYTNLGILYNCEKKWKEADEYLSQAISIGRNTKDIYRLTKSLIVRGNYYLFQNLPEEAVLFFEESEKFSEDNHYYYRQQEALFKLADCHAIMGNDDEFSNYSKKLFYIQKKIGLNGGDDLYEIN